MIVISTAFKTAQIGVESGNKRCLRELDANCKHSENVLSTLASMLDEMGLEPSDIDTFGVVIGPGSFTGLRIGIALVKGLCAGGENKKAIPLSSFEYIAYSYIKQNKPSCDFWVVINALSGLLFVQKFSASGKALNEGKLVPRGEFEEIKEPKVCLEEDNLPYIIVKPTTLELLEYAKEKEKSKDFCDYHVLSPIYLRKSQAEVQLEAKKSKKS